MTGLCQGQEHPLPRRVAPRLPVSAAQRRLPHQSARAGRRHLLKDAHATRAFGPRGKAAARANARETFSRISDCRHGRRRGSDCICTPAQISASAARDAGMCPPATRADRERMLEAVKPKPPVGGGLRPVLTAPARDAPNSQTGTKKQRRHRTKNTSSLILNPSYKSFSSASSGIYHRDGRAFFDLLMCITDQNFTFL